MAKATLPTPTPVFEDPAPPGDSDRLPKHIGLGVDIGGTGMKAALVDVENGRIVGERSRVSTPSPATIAAVSEALDELVRPLLGSIPEGAPVGVAFPAVVRRGVVLSAVNIADEWMYADLGSIFSEVLGHAVWALNDGDAAAFAESRHGAGRHHNGTMVTVTLGTGVGTGLVVDGWLVPNVELGSLTVRGKRAERRISDSARKARKVSWRAWSRDLQRFVEKLDEAVAPDLVIVGGGLSSLAQAHIAKVRARPVVVAARLRNDAGIVGAACFAALQASRREEAALPA